MSRARAKGSGWETELLPLLRLALGSQVNRAPLMGINDMGDFNGTGDLLIEAKKTDQPRFLLWAKVAQKKKPGKWIVFWSGDRRRGDGPFCLLPMSLVLELLDDTALAKVDL